MNQHQPTPIGLSVRDAAALTSLGEKYVRDAVNSGEIPARRRGTRIVIDYDTLVDWYRGLPPVVDKSA